MMCAYLITAPREFNVLNAGFVTLCPSMLLLMAISWVYPIGGVTGILIALAFVLFSGVGLLLSLHKTLHEYSASQHVEGAYEITLGVLIIFWNLVVLLMRLAARD